MKLWFISQPNENVDYDTYDSAVVAAETEEEAKVIQPSRFGSGWCAPEDVAVEYLGEAKEGTVKGVICASFNAG